MKTGIVDTTDGAEVDKSKKKRPSTSTDSGSLLMGGPSKPSTADSLLPPQLGSSSGGLPCESCNENQQMAFTKQVVIIIVKSAHVFRLIPIVFTVHYIHTKNESVFFIQKVCSP